VFQKLRRFAEFFTSQGITTAGNLLYGFLCVRLLPIPDYAKFAVVFGCLGTMTVLMDIGFSKTLLPLVGDRINDRQLIADYVAALRQLAHWLYLAVAPLLVIIFPLAVRRQPWSWHTVAAMVSIVLIAGWMARVAGIYGAVLIVRRDRSVWYRVQMISSLGTLFLLLVAWSVHWLSAFLCILINVAGIVFCGTAYYIRARRLLGVTGHASKQKRQAIVHLALPSIPNTVFYALQSQIALLLITLFGGIGGVASVGALSRLSRLFVVFSQMNPILIEPYFASLPKAQLKYNYVGIAALVSAFGGTMSVLAKLFPEPFLWILGPKYSDLRFEAFLAITGAAISYISGALWTIHSSRQFVYWWNNLANICLTTLVQAIFIWKTDLSSVDAVLLFNIAASGASLFINILCGIYGFTRGPRTLVDVSA
jgi:O-antigen/teichoic acid export membrane protein